MNTNERLVEAAKAGNLDEVQRLVDQDADVNEGEIPSFLWAYFNGHHEVCRWLLSNGGNVNHDGFSEMTLLMAATVHGDVEFVSFLIDAGADVNLPLPAGGETALHKAAVRNQAESMKTLIVRGGDVNRRTKVGGKTAMDGFETVWGETPLHIAAVAADERVINLLLDSGANKDIRTSQGKTAFDYAGEKQRELRIVDALCP